VAFVALLTEYLPHVADWTEWHVCQTDKRCCCYGPACRGHRQGPLANLRATWAHEY